MVDPAEIVEQVKTLIEPLLASRHVELVELTCHPTGGQWRLRCLVDTARGITLDELSFLSRSIGAILEEHDTIPERYLLEVSSPGLDRPLKSSRDFERVVGRRVRVITSSPVESRTEHGGVLLNAGEEAILLRLDSGAKIQIPLNQIARAVQDVQI